MRSSLLALISRKEDSPAEKQAYHDGTHKVDAQSPPGLCIAAGEDSVNSCQQKDYQR
jgi:hypothetical protein